MASSHRGAYMYIATGSCIYSKVASLLAGAQLACTCRWVGLFRVVISHVYIHNT